MKKGFTLIELLGVISLLGVLVLICYPIVLEQIEKKQQEVSSAKADLIYSAADTYMGKHPEEYPYRIGNQFCISLDTLVEQNEVAVDVSDVKQRGIQVTMGSNHNITYRLVNGCIMGYVEENLNGANPVLRDGLIPVILSNDGTVTKADIDKKWYSYQNKEWANAVILKDETITYGVNQIIPEENIESYFVWVPKYSYQIWDLGQYNSLEIIDSSKVHSIEIQFGIEDTNDSIQGQCTTPKVAGESGNCKVGDYMTHPAFLAFNTNGLWVGKFETGYDGATSKEEAQQNKVDANKVVIKPNTYSWRDVTIGNTFKTSYTYKRNYESHVMKNTEWGAVAYLSHSAYGANKEVTINDHPAFMTGYANHSAPYNTEAGYVASTTGNITGIYDMSGGTHERVMGYSTMADVVGAQSDITTLYPEFFTSSRWNRYYDKYTDVQFNNRILGDAITEMGPFQNMTGYNMSSWYHDSAYFATQSEPWLVRGGTNGDGESSGIFKVLRSSGQNSLTDTFRIVLAI